MFANFKKHAVMLAAAFILIAFGFVLGTTVLNTNASSVHLLPDAQAPSSSLPDPITENERYFASIYERVSPSVVSINVVGLSQDGNLFSAGGTGFVIDKDGHIVTNNHVVDGAERIEVNFLDGTIVRGQVVGLDPDSDLAVLKVDLPADRLSPVGLGDSNNLFIGETTVAIGSPFGQRWTLTTGVISALDRTISGLTDFTVGAVIQTDAAINPGNSGGPLLNLQGEVIGVNSQILSETRSSSGIGFAIPSNLVRRVATELIENGFVNYSYLGIQSQPDRDVSLPLIEANNLPNNLRGVVVDSVAPNGPASRAGLRSAGNATRIDGQLVPTSVDIITAIDGVQLTGMSSLVAYLASNTVPGQTVNLTVWRDGQQINLPVVLGSRPR
ncbi:MAG: trypsin-like peptidase domain-containing protein [Anaerolineae bacterium]|nr:trypsin-like peptidase domain-containing protein [Anaerolineae bacterium]